MIHHYHHKVLPAYNFLLQRRYGILFYSLLLTMVAVPILSILNVDIKFLGLFLSANLATALAGIKNRHLSRLLLAILFITLVIRYAAGFADMRPVEASTTLVTVVLSFIAATDAVRDAMISTKINAEHLYAALSAYILFGLFFGVLHWAIGEQWPGAYSVPEGGDITLHAAIYFSFVTQTTLGYGDIYPRIEIARGLALMQAIAGQLYLAVMLARLVSLYVTNSDKDKP